MKQKIFTLFLMLVISIGTLFAESGTCGENLTWDLTDGVLTISGTGDMTNWEGSVDVPWDRYRYSIKVVSIGNSVTSIGNYAFWKCSSLTSITIPNSVISIGDDAFEGCTGLTYPVYNAHVFAYMPTSFVGAYSIPEGIKSIAGGAFKYCTGLTSITIPNSVTSIGFLAIFGCTGLTSPVYNTHVFAYMPTSFTGAYAIHDGIESIASAAFYGCTGLTSITIPNSVTNIGDAAFSGCTSLTSPIYTAREFVFLPISYSGAYTIPDGIEYIAMEAIVSCTELTSITIPNSVTRIGFGNFLNCTGLTSVTIGKGVTSIGYGSFTDCSNLTTLTCYAATPPSLDDFVFSGVNCSRTTLYVPAGSIDAYKVADKWKDFGSILPAPATDTTDVIMTTTENSVDITWPAVEGAYTYELVIKDQNGNVVCTLVFNAQGQLLSIAFHAPTRNDAPQQTQTAGFAFTVTGLEKGATYNYTLTAKDSNGNILNTESGSFVTEAPQGVEDVDANINSSRKLLRNGQLLIEKAGVRYNAAGAIVK